MQPPFLRLLHQLLAFYVNGVKVGTSTTLSATTCAWQQLSTTWNSGSSTTGYLEIRNENTNTGGNDFAIDDISMTVDVPAVSYSWTGPNSFSATTQNIYCKYYWNIYSNCNR